PTSRKLRAGVDSLQGRLTERQVSFEQAKAAYDAKGNEERELNKGLTDALATLKKQYGEFDRVARTAAQKHWGFGDTFRRLPIIDGFASPIKIQQITLEDLPIDYAFKYVPRFDRCTTCHLGIDRSGYTQDALKALAEAP